MKLNYKFLLKSTLGEARNIHELHEISGIEMDSRKVNKELCFFPVLGETFDGHQFIVRAFEAGASVSFCEKAYFYAHYETLQDLPLILVDNTTKALHRLTKFVLDLLKPQVVAITGSVGKTSTKEFIYHVLDQKYSVHKNKGNFNNHIGLPLTVLDLEEEHEIAVLEMGMNHMKEIETLVSMAQPSVAVITNIGTSHIGNLGSQNNIFQAKLEITSYLKKSDALILNGEDQYLKGIKSESFDVFKVGSEVLLPYDLYIQNNGCYSYFLNYEGNKYQVKLNVLGKHNIQNSLLAFMVGLRLDISIDHIIKGLANFEDNKGRLDIFSLKGDVEIISDCYNASEDSTKSALEVLNNRDSKHKVVILGDILELGSYSESTHRRIGHYLSKLDVELVCYGKESEFILKEALDSGLCKTKGKHFENQEELIVYVKSMIQPNTSILVKGSFGMNMIKIVEELIKE